MEPKIKISLAIVAIISGLGFSRYYHSVDQQLLQISKEYKSYHLFRRYTDMKDSLTYTQASMDSSQLMWIIADCRSFNSDDTILHGTLRDGLNDSLHYSKPDSLKSPHGDKMYKLYVKDWEAYASKKNPQPNGQVLVKEVWNVKEAVGLNNHVYIPVKQSKNDLKFYTPTTRSKLFIMYKTINTNETDNGWWYGIVDIEKGIEQATVLESMKINRCIKCHAETKYDRIFGL